MDVSNRHYPLQLYFLSNLRVNLIQVRQITRDALLVLLHVLIYGRQVLDTISIICAVHITSDDFETALLHVAIFLYLVVLLHTLSGAIVPIDHGSVAWVLHLQLNEKLTDISADSGAALV